MTGVQTCALPICFPVTILKAQFYKVVEKEYNVYVCYPGGKLPIPIDVPYPTKRGETKYFKGGM